MTDHIAAGVWTAVISIGLGAGIGIAFGMVLVAVLLSIAARRMHL